MSIKTVFLDMDGVLTNFRRGCEKADAIHGTKVDWDKIHKLGKTFWAELEWLDGSKEFYKWLVNYCKEQKLDLCILSAVNYSDGVAGKHEWLDKNCPDIPKQNRYIVNFGRQKNRYASETAVLIDDFGKNIESFIMANGRGVKFDTPMQTKEDLTRLA